MDNKKLSGIFMPGASSYLWIIFILLVVISVFNIWVAIPGYLLLAFLVYYNYRTQGVRRKELTHYIENLTFNIDTATRDTLLNFPMPLVLLELDGTIIWYNSSFRRIFEGEEILEKTISSLISGLNPGSLVTGGGANITQDVAIGDRHYNVLGNMVKTDEKNDSDGYILMLYLLDQTELINMKSRYAGEKTAVGLVLIDNYDDLMQSMEDVMRPQMLAEIDRCVVQWSAFTEGVVKKFERDKYLFVFEIKHLKEMEDRRFDVLDTVKEIALGNKIPVTLSIGIGINGASILENFRFAGACLDIALGRGGDHVVIRNGESFSFYGGKTRELEKRTRVKARVMAYALRELIDQAPQVFIMGHENADLDSLGASLGVFRVVKNRGKDAFIVLSRTNPAVGNLMSKIEKDPEYANVFISHAEARERIGRRTLLVVLDTHRPAFTECPDLLELTDEVVVIDHHRRGAEYIQDTVLVYQETYASSTCELVTEILQYVEDKIRLKPVEAEALYAGIVVDTKNFILKTGVRTFEAASFLRKQGVDTISVKQLFQNDIKTYSAISDVVRDAEIINDSIALSSCPPNLKNAQAIAAQAADQLLSLSGIDAAFVLSMSGSEVVISGRSLGEVNVQMILERLGGGGHLSVAGAQLQGVTMEEARKKLRAAIDENGMKAEG